MWSLKGWCAARKSNEMLVDMVSTETEMRELGLWHTASTAARLKTIEHKMLRFGRRGQNGDTCPLKTSWAVSAISSAWYCFYSVAHIS